MKAKVNFWGSVKIWEELMARWTPREHYHQVVICSKQIPYVNALSSKAEQKENILVFFD